MHYTQIINREFKQKNWKDTYIPHQLFSGPQEWPQHHDQEVQWLREALLLCHLHPFCCSRKQERKKHELSISEKTKSRSRGDDHDE